MERNGRHTGFINLPAFEEHSYLTNLLIGGIHEK